MPSYLWGSLREGVTFVPTPDSPKDQPPPSPTSSTSSLASFHTCNTSSQHNKVLSPELFSPTPTSQNKWPSPPRIDVGLNSRGEVLSLTDSKLVIRATQGVTERTSLNWMFGVSWMLLMLSSCVWGCSDSISGEVISSSM